MLVQNCCVPCGALGFSRGFRTYEAMSILSITPFFFSATVRQHVTLLEQLIDQVQRFLSIEEVRL